MSSDNSNTGGPRRRRRSARGGRGGGMPPIMWLAVVVCVAGAVFLFRSGDGNIPTGIGEIKTTVTAAEVESTLADLGLSAPHSGDVDINAQERALTPEKPADAATATAGSSGAGTASPTAPVQKPDRAPPKTTPQPTSTPVKKPTKRRAANPPGPLIQPVDVGPYVVQVGSFGEAENADKEAARLKKLGWDALVKVGNTSDGAMIYRVRIAYFRSRAEAESFIRQNKRHIPGAIPAHR